jgi:diguanylate cyclase (GGDEF)-like protein/PAS domain S-box-containing protein
MNYEAITDFIKYNQGTLDLIMDMVPIPLFIKDRNGIYMNCNNAFTKFLTTTREEVIGKSEYDIWGKEDADEFSVQDETLLSQGGSQVYETTIRSSNGAINIVQFHKQVFTDPTGATAGFLGVIFDITENKKLATIDELTGLPNRRDGMAKLEILHKESVRKKRPYCLVMTDLDYFKQINDNYGHQKGDIVLREFANVTRSILRSSDICFRYGGEEFIILLPETKLEDGLVVVDRLRKAWSNNFVAVNNHQIIHSTISSGLVQYPKNGMSFEQLIKESDKALYEAKNGGRDCIVCSKHGNRQRNYQRVKITNDVPMEMKM